jgi:membrane fusion protein, multidrug efflux system
MRPRLYRQIIAAVLTGLIAVVISGCSDGKAKQSAQRTVPVTTGEVTRRNVPMQITAIGNVEAYNTVSIKAQIGGEVLDVHFREGQDVKQGDLLFQIDPRPYQAALRQAEAQLARDAAQARSAEEQAKRYQILVQKDYVSRDQYDQLRANADASAAVVDADKANVENSRLQLAYCTIKSPINGRVGTVLVNKGNIIKANDAVMVTINQMTPIYVTFSAPEKSLAEINKQRSKKALSIDVYVDRTEPKSEKGNLTFVDNAVDSSTGTIKLKGTFSNSARRLWPGQFVNVVLTLYTQRDAIVVPTQAVQSGQTGQYVYVVNKDMSAEIRQVVISRTFENDSIIEKGLAAGEKVVTEGQLRLSAGAKVQIKNGTDAEAITDNTLSTAPSKTAVQSGKK